MFPIPSLCRMKQRLLQNMNGKSESSLKAFALIQLLLAICFVTYLRIESGAYPGDDAYMTLKAARNIAAGNGFVHNVGERVYCTTTPLYALLVAALSFATTLDPVTVAFVLNGALDPLVVCALFWLILSQTSSYALAGASALLFSVSRFFLSSSHLLMESSLFTFLALASLCAYSLKGRRRILLGIFVGLLILTRPEGGLFALMYLFYLCWKERRLPLRELSGCFLVTLPWLLFAFYYFGTPIPHSIIAKAASYSRSPGETFSLLTAAFTEQFASVHASGILRRGICGVLLLLYFLGVHREWKRGSLLLVYHLFALAFVVAYSVANPFMFEWYFTMPEPSYCIGILVGIRTVLSRLLPVSRQAVALSLGTILWAFALGSQYFAEPFVRHPSGLGTRFNPDFFEREALYERAARDLEAEVSKETKIVAPEFGAFSYHSSAKLLSSLGHINPEVVPFLDLIPKSSRPGINNGVPREMLQGLRPDYLVSLEMFLSDDLRADDWFAAHYQVVREYPSKAFGISQNLLVYKRVGPM
ncbi:MAG: hypothetical protein KDD69_15515 [Bdellovibrionales bacterium]|nr:hypothetical protein [Bdellovibrionales bacterium]